MSNPKPYLRGDYPYRSVDDIQYANDRAGFHFFEESTMRFFGSRALDGVISGRYFITSERDTFDRQSRAPRAYTVREALPSGRVETVGDFQAFKSADSARRHAQRLPGDSAYMRRVIDSEQWTRDAAESGDWRKIADYCGLTDKRDRLLLRQTIRAMARERIAA